MILADAGAPRTQCVLHIVQRERGEQMRCFSSNALNPLSENIAWLCMCEVYQRLPPVNNC